jgi:hypothetical protein
MLTDTSRWSHARGNEVVPSRWQATKETASAMTHSFDASNGGCSFVKFAPHPGTRDDPR